MKTIRFYFLAAITFALLSAAVVWLPSAHADSLGFSIAEDPSQATIQVSVVDDATGKAISDAQVAITDTVGMTRVGFDPFNLDSYDHVFSTAADGNVRFNPASSAPKVISVTHAGYSHLTLVGVTGTKVTVQLKPLETNFPDAIASGQVGSWDNRAHPEGKPVHLGLVFKTIGGLDLLHFNIASVISPIQDTIDIFGERKIPSNLVMPAQDIPIFFTSVHVDKQNYRLPVPSGNPTQLSVIEGNVNSDDLMSLAQGGKPNASALNSFNFSRVGVSASSVPTGDFKLDLNPDQMLSDSPAHTVTVTKPPFASDVIVAAVTDLTGDRSALLPTDLKSPLNAANFSDGPQPVSLKTTSASIGKSRGVLSVAATEDGKKLSGVIVDPAPAQVSTGDFLAVPDLADSSALPGSITIPAPSQNGLSAVIFEAARPTTRSGDPLGDLLSKLPPRTFPTWYVYTLPSAGSVTFPTANVPTTRLWSMVSLEFGKDFQERSIDGRTALKQLKRFTRANAQIK